MTIHPRTRQIQLAEIAVAELLLANEAADPCTAARRIRNAIQTAQDYAATTEPVGARRMQEQRA